MLNKDLIVKIATGLADFKDVGKQVLEGDGLDGIMSILNDLRLVEYPALVLEDQSIGQFNILPGSTNTYSQSLWVMCLKTPSSSDRDCYRKAFDLSRKIIGKMLALHAKDEPDLEGWQFQSISYSKRYGGPSVRGYEIVFNFKENFSFIDG